jgi:hypothetical protein
MPTPESSQLRALAARVADALPSESVPEAVLTGSVSRGVADGASDIEMLVVTYEQLSLDECFGHAATAGLTGLDTWGPQDTLARRVSGYREGVPIELIWWSCELAETRVAAGLAGELSGTPDALVHGLPLRTCGLLADWQARLHECPAGVASAWIEDAALTWGGFAPAGLLTVARPGERLALLERMVDDASRVVRIVFAVNRAWPPTLKRLAARVEPLAVKPDRLGERIEDALTEPDPYRALLVMTELQADTAALAPSGPNIDRARLWLAEAAELLSRGQP